MKYEFGRRSFMKVSGCSVLGAIIGSQFKFTSAFADTNTNDLPNNFSGDIHTHCGLCVNKCGVVARVENGRIRKLDPILDHPKSKGMLCAKGNAGIQAVYDPDRLKYPMIRVGKRGEGKWRRATWDEALTYVADKLTAIKEKYGPESVLFSSTEGFQEHFFLHFAEAYGSPNTVRHPTLCLASVNNAMFNTFGTVPHFDLKNAKYVIFAGANRLESLLTPDTVDMIDGKASGHYHVVLDPRFTVTASKANLWVPIKPGTDLAFALALIHMIIKENKYDKTFVEKYTYGFDKLVSHVQKYTPEWAASETGIPVETIYKIGKDFMSNLPRSVFYSGRRGSWNENDTQFRRAIAIVNAISGCWDSEGGAVPPRKIGLGEMLIFPPDEPEAERIDNVKNEFPLANRKDGVYLTLREHALKEDPYALKGWMIYKQNPLQSVPNSQKTYEMMKKMELIVSIDIIPNDTAWEGDVMLPEATYLERTDPLHSLAGLEPAVALRQQVITPMYESRPNLDIMKELAGKLDLSDYFDFTIDEWLEAQVEELPIGLDELKSRGFYADDKGRIFGNTRKEGYRFRTKTGKIELYSERYAEKGYDPLPIYHRPKDIPSGSYILLTSRYANYTHSSLQNNEWLMAVGMHDKAQINPIVAKKHGIKQGDIITLRSSYGDVELPVLITDRVHTDVICIPHGYGHTSKGLNYAYNKGARVSDLLGTYYDKITGNAAMHQDFVQILPKGTPHIEQVPGEQQKSKIKSGGVKG
ncbi:MAG TPA: molybdopterin oxidoreductase [candidate division Zixibacteria bacterium]|nr:molybdopterin oxidoreductase [candidate division Zixibacteria bacterium]